MQCVCWLPDAAPTLGSAMRGSSNCGRISVCAQGCARFLQNSRMSSAIWVICRRKALSKQAAYSRTFPPSTPGTLTWAFPNQRLAKPSTCSVEGTVRCKETRTTRLCGLGDRFPPTSYAPSSRWRIRHLRCPFAGLRPPAFSATPLCFSQIRVFASSIDTSPSHRRAWHYSFMSRPAGATSLLRYINLATTRSIISSAIGCLCAATLAKLRYGRFQTDSTTPSHPRASTCGFKQL